MVCGLVDIEFCKIVLGLQNLGVHKFLNSNINLASGSNNFTVFHPGAPEEQETAMSPEAKDSFDSFCSWDKLEIPEKGRSVRELLGYLEHKFAIRAVTLSAEINYNPPQSVDLWKEGDKDDVPLSQIFQVPRIHGHL